MLAECNITSVYSLNTVSNKLAFSLTQNANVTPIVTWQKWPVRLIFSLRKTGLQEKQAGAASHSAEGRGEEECSGNQGEMAVFHSHYLPLYPDWSLSPPSAKPHTHTSIIHHTSPTWEQLKQSPYWWGKEESFDSQRTSSLSPFPSPLLSLCFSFSLSCHSRITIQSLRKQPFYSLSLCDFHLLVALVWSSIRNCYCCSYCS